MSTEIVTVVAAIRRQLKLAVEQLVTMTLVETGSTMLTETLVLARAGYNKMQGTGGKFLPVYHAAVFLHGFDPAEGGGMMRTELSLHEELSNSAASALLRSFWERVPEQIRVRASATTNIVLNDQLGQGAWLHARNREVLRHLTMLEGALRVQLRPHQLYPIVDRLDRLIDEVYDEQDRVNISTLRVGEWVKLTAQKRQELWSRSQ